MAQVKFVRGNKKTKQASWNSKVTTDSIAFDKDNKEIYLGSDKYSQTKLTELTNDNAALQVGDSLNVVFSKLNNIIIDNEEITAAALNDLNNHKVNTEDLATVATTGSYNDLTDKPNIPVGPMVFKGSLGTGGTITTLPTASSDNTGHTYKVITDGTYASQSAKAGDIFVSDGNAWILIPSGTVTSVGMTVPTGLSVSGSPVTTSGTLVVSYANGYSIPTTAKQTEWDNKISAVKTLKTNNTTAQTASASETLSGSGTINLHKVSKTGSYNDLLDKPTIPTIPNLSKGTTTGKGNAVTDITVNGHTITLTKGTTFASVASPTFTGTPAAPTAASGTNTTQIATTAFVQQELANFDDEIFVPVSTLPTTNIKTNKIYIVPNSLASPENNLYDEYIYKNNAWELIGTSQIDLNGKQDKLISGTNIKTVNDKSLLGSGDVPIIIEGTYHNGVFTSYTYDANTGYTYQLPAAYTGNTRILYVDTISNVIYRYDGSQYVKLYNFNTDSTPTSGSSNFVTSGGVYNALYKSGTTAQRPTTNLVVGMQYFDTTLGQPIWWNGTAWVDALGNTPGSRNYVYVENN